MQILKTVLKRGSLGDKEYNDRTPQRARERASALAELHSVQATQEGDKFVVDASEYYDKPAKTQASK